METYMGSGLYPKQGNHDIRVKFQWGKYKGFGVTSLGGNSVGGSVIQTVASGIDDLTFKRCKENEKCLVFNDDDEKRDYEYPLMIHLYDKENNCLEIDGEDIEKCVVGIEIIDFQEEN